MEECRFCQIVAGERDAYVLFEDDRTIAFLDADPATQGHVLVVPTTHVEDLLTADEAIAASVMETAQHVASALESTLEPDGFSVFHTTGGLVGTVEHAHLHVLPREVDDRITISLQRDSLRKHDPDRLAERLRAAL